MKNLLFVFWGLLILTLGRLFNMHRPLVLCVSSGRFDQGETLDVDWSILAYSTNSIGGGSYPGSAWTFNDPPRKKELSDEERKKLKTEQAELENRLKLLESIEQALCPRDKIQQLKKSAENRLSTINEKLK